MCSCRNICCQGRIAPSFARNSWQCQRSRLELLCMETLIAPAWHGHNPITKVGNLHSRLLSMFFILELISRMVVTATVVWVTLNSVFYLKQFKQRHKTNKQTKINRDTSTGLSQVSFSKNAIFSAYATLLLYICLGKNTSYHFCLATTETDSI